MTKEYIFAGKTTEQAIENGLKELNMDRDEVSVEIVEMAQKGLFGIGAKDAKVKLLIEVPDEKPVRKPEPKKPEAKKAEPKKAEPKKDEAKKAELKKDEPFVPTVMPGESIAPKKRRPEEPKAEVKAEKPKKPEKLVPKEQLEKGGEICKQFLQEALSGLEIQADITVSTDNNCVLATLVGDGMGLIIGRRGETLDALQTLASLVVNKGKGDYIRVVLDTEGYRQKREEALEALAHRMADKALKYKKNMTLEAMNPYERRIIHSALQGVPHITTKSVGSEPNRKVVVCFVR